MADRKGFERKHFFIDRRLQGRYMLTFLVPMLVMLGFMLFTLAFASQSIVKSSTRMIRRDIDNLVVAALQDRPDPSAAVYEKAIEDVDDYLRTFASSAGFRRTMLTSLLWIFGLGVFIVIIQIVLLTVYFSHKVAGPIYRLEKVCTALADGDYSQRVMLRKGDELQNLAALLGGAIEKTRARMAALRDEPDDKKRQEIASSMRL
ncbi:MAG: hypothetical protein GF331_23350 [Chitinivibrionales bacterium]|nr:hypothetical protein [Chitinivibrionales bacterium]